MKKKRLSKLWSNRHVPEQIWREILCRLPVKYLLRFRCVSKSWLSLIEDPEFCRLHLKNFKNNINGTHLLVVEGRQQNCVVRCSCTFAPNKEKLHTLGLNKMFTVGIWQVACSSRDGLVLLKSYSPGFPSKTVLVVWNPSIRKFHDLPFLPDLEADPNSNPTYFHEEEIGLGYDPLVKDYKLFTLISNNDGLHSLAVCTIGTGSWKIIRLKGNDISIWNYHLDSYVRGVKTVYLNGKLYLSGRHIERKTRELVSFDVSNHVSSSIDFPEDSILSSTHCSEDSGPLTLVDGGCTLAVFDFESPASMWVLESPGSENEPAYWTKRYSFDFNIEKFLYYNKNGDMLMQWFGLKTSFELPTGKKVEEKWDVVSSYNLETRMENVLIIKKRRDLTFHGVYDYVESLVMLKKISIKG